MAHQVVAALSGERPGPATRAEDIDLRGLRLYVRLNLTAVLVAIVVLIIVRILVVPDDWLEVAAGLLVAMAILLRRADGWVCHNRAVAAVRMAIYLNWTAAVLAVLIAPFTLMIVCVIVVLPVLLAVPHLTRARLEPMSGAAIVVSATVAMLGRWQHGVGLPEMMPAWLLDCFAIGFVPLHAGLSSVLAWLNHVSLSARAAALQESRERLVAAGDRERRRVERALHNGTQRRLTVTTNRLRATRSLLPDRPGEVAAVLGQLADELRDTGAELRELAHGIYPPELAAYGLQAALRSAARRAPLPTTVSVEGVTRYRPEVELSVYSCCVEALLNAAEHGGIQARASVALHGEPDGSLSFQIDDTGLGCDPALARAGQGLTSMADRLGALGGSLTVVARPGAGVHLYGHIDAPGSVDPSRRWRRVEQILGATWMLACRMWGGNWAVRSSDTAMAGLRALRLFAVAGVGVDLVVYAVIPNPWVLALAAGSAALALVQTWALSTIQRSRTLFGVLVVDVAGSLFMISCTALVPVTLYYHTIIALIPGLLAAPMLSRRHFFHVVVGNVLIAVALVLAGLLLPGVGVQERAPVWLVDLFVTVLVVVCTNLLLFLAWLNHVSLSERASALQTSRKRLVAAADRERRRIERDLHDGAQQRLAATAMRLRAAQRLLLGGGDQVDNLLKLLDELTRELRKASDELKELARGIYPPELVEHGLAKALRSMARRSPVPTTIELNRVGRYRPEVELGVYFCCLEGLQNAIKHAGLGALVHLRVREEAGGDLSFEVSDTGPGWDPSVTPPGHGLTNMADRLGAAGGTLCVVARPGIGVRLHGRVTAPDPVAPPAARP
jgi:signal transduction histidine kinase